MGLGVARKNGGLPPTSSGVVDGLAFCDYPKFLSLPYRFIRDRRFHSTIEMIILKLRKSLNRKGSRCIVDILSDESSHFEDALGNQREGASELRRAETWTKNLELISKLRRHDQLVIVINRLFKFLEKLQIALILEEGEEGGKKEIKKILLLLLKAWELLAQRLQQLFLSAWMPEFPNNFRHPCTTMPWTIWPALAVLWGVCWMFYDDGNFWNLINVSETNLQPNTEEDLRQDETVLGRNGSLSGDLHSGPIPINESPVFDDFSIFDYVPSYVPSYVPGETSHRRATNWPHDDLVANDKQPAAIPGNDDIDYPGLIMTIGEHATLSSAVPQTQLNLQAEQQASLMLQPTTGISEGQENSHTAVAGLPFECSVASCDKTFTTKSGLTWVSPNHLILEYNTLKLSSEHIQSAMISPSYVTNAPIGLAPRKSSTATNPANIPWRGLSSALGLSVNEAAVDGLARITTTDMSEMSTRDSMSLLPPF